MLRSTRLCALSATALGAALLCGCSPSTTTVVWEERGLPRHNASQFSNWQYKFVYYPGTDVYFEPHTHTYYWFDGEFWFEGRQLPRHINIQFIEPRIVKLNNFRPYMQHGYIVDRYASHQVKPGATDASAVGQIEPVGHQHWGNAGMDDEWFWMGDAEWMSWDGQGAHPGHKFASEEDLVNADAQTQSTTSGMTTQAQPDRE